MTSKFIQFIHLGGAIGKWVQATVALPSWSLDLLNYGVGTACMGKSQATAQMESGGYYDIQLSVPEEIEPVLNFVQDSNGTLSITLY